MIAPMRLLLVSALAVFSVIAISGQERKGGGPPTNLKVLPANSTRPEVIQVMRGFTAALGVQCAFCHVQGNFASDDNPKKNMARMMLTMARQINMNFPDGKRHVTCYTCHRGAQEPATEPPAAQ